jgi:hypothetical protein
MSRNCTHRDGESAGKSIFSCLVLLCPWGEGKGWVKWCSSNSPTFLFASFKTSSIGIREGKGSQLLTYTLFRAIRKYERFVEIYPS